MRRTSRLATTRGAARAVCVGRTEEAPWDLLRLNAAPRFYIKTVDEGGVPILPDVIVTIGGVSGRRILITN